MIHTSVDSLDLKIIELLSIDGRQNSRVMAKKLNVSSVAVRRRISALLNEDKIRITAVADLKITGISTAAILCLDVKQENVEEALTVLVNREEIR